MIAIIDYGVGNLFSLSSAFDALMMDESVIITNDREKIRSASRLVLPGVGAFGDAMDKLCRDGLDLTVREEVKKGKPLLGICLGMQLLFKKSYEYGIHTGLGLIPGEVVPFEGKIPQSLCIPHMGWNSLELLRRDCPLFSRVADGEYVYFVHSYFADNCTPDTVAVTDYSLPVTAAVARENVFGCQFHPEKSGKTGQNILRGFCEV